MKSSIPSRIGAQGPTDFVCDIRKAMNDFGWKPTTSVTDGLGKLWKWVHASQAIIRKVLAGRPSSMGLGTATLEISASRAAR
jgi:hypothetical protein